MKKIVLIAALMLVLPTLAFADISLSASAGVTAGISIGPTVLLKCHGYKTISNPWVDCQDLGSSTDLDFGTLSTQLKNPDGTDKGGAGCFYAPDYFILYLFPEAHGGHSYIITHNPASGPAAILNALVVTPVYAKEDSYKSGGAPQGDMDAYELANNSSSVINHPQLAKNSVQIFRSMRPRIVRAQYGIPPYPATGDPIHVPVDVTTSVATYSLSITITVSESAT